MKTETRKAAGMIISAINALVGAGTFVLGCLKVKSDIKKTKAQTEVMEAKVKEVAEVSEEKQTEDE